MKIDVILGLQYGDEGKGKVCHSLLNGEHGANYTHVVRFNGGGNAGHTIYHNGKKMVTHLIPAGVFFGKKSIIGPGCVVNPKKFFEELNYLKSEGIQTDGLVFVAKNAHVVTEDHVFEDSRDVKIGTTKTGNGPAYRDKYNRTGLKAENFNELKPYLIDMYEEFYGIKSSTYEVLAEGAQAFGLDVDWGDYPYVTSSHCGIGSVLLNGFNHRDIRNVYGIAKAYDTYVGEKKFQDLNDTALEKIQEVGNEFGSTTGRKRQCNWMDWDLISKAIRMNGVNHLIVNKVDVLESVGVWKIKLRGETREYNSTKEFCSVVRGEAESLWVNCKFSFNPYDI